MTPPAPPWTPERLRDALIVLSMLEQQFREFQDLLESPPSDEFNRGKAAGLQWARQRVAQAQVAVRASRRKVK